MANFLDEHGLSVVWERIKELIDKKILKGLADKLDKQNSKGTGYIAYNPYNSNNIGNYASVLGYHCDSTSYYAHSEGYGCTASGTAAHAEGYNTYVGSSYSHAEGYEATASGTAAHAEGYYTKANSSYQHVQGKYNVIDSSSTYADIVGWGTSTSSSGRKNIEATTTTGDKRLKGDVYVHCNDDSTGGSKLALESDLTALDTRVTAIGTRIIKAGGTDYTTDLTTAADTVKNIASISLPAGMWIVIARVRFSPTSSGNHYSTVGFTQISAEGVIEDRRYGTSNYANQHNLSKTYNFTDKSSDTTVYLTGDSNVAGKWVRSGATAFNISAIKIG